MSDHDIQNCIHCGICRDNCAFLSKYDIEIGDTKRLKELAYHCFLCGNCTTVCPVHIDGRQVVLDLRRERVAYGERQAVEKKYRGLIREKRDYIYRNWKHATGGSVFFPGCNFPSMYPGTTALLERILKEQAGIGTVHDCCGKPIAELGLEDEERRITEGISSRLRSAGVSQVIVLCPNCYYYLRDRLDIPVVSIYDKLHELGLGAKISGGDKVFMPCPDRESGTILSQIEEYFTEGPYRRISGVQCCGLGGSAGVREPELAGSIASELTSEDGLRVYCASCAGRLKRNGTPGVRHILTEILGTDEDPDTGKSAINRVLTKFR